MAEEYDDRFKSEVMRLLSTLILKVDKSAEEIVGIKEELSSVKTIVTQNSSDIKIIKQDIKILSGQFTDVTQMVLKDNQRITKLETEVEDLKSSIH